MLEVLKELMFIMLYLTGISILAKIIAGVLFPVKKNSFSDMPKELQELMLKQIKEDMKNGK